MKHIFALALTLTLSACAVQQAIYEKQMANWKGKHKDELLAVWGQPVMVQPFAKDMEIYLYQYSRTVKKPAKGAYTAYENVEGTIQPVRHGYKPERLRNERCEYRFMMMPNGLIDSVRWRGNACGV